MKRLLLLTLILTGLALGAGYPRLVFSVGGFHGDTLPDSVYTTRHEMQAAIAAAAWDSLMANAGWGILLTFSADTMTVEVNRPDLDTAYAPIGLDSVGKAAWADSADEAAHAYAADSAAFADSCAQAAHSYASDSSAFADSSAEAGHAGAADSSAFADSSGQAAHAYDADSAGEAGHAYVADSAGLAAFADSCRAAAYADSCRAATYADSCRIAAYADSTRAAAYADSCRAAAYADSCRAATYADSSDVTGSSGSCTGQAATVATIAGLTADTTAGGAARATLAANATNAETAAVYSPAAPDSTVPLRGDGVAARPVGVFYETDFLVLATSAHTYPWYTATVGSGTALVISTDVNHPGVCRMSSSTSANTGGQSRIGTGSVILGGSEQTDIVWSGDTMTGSTYYIGFHNSVDQTRYTDGCSFIVRGTLARGFNINNGTADSTASTYTMTKSQWYRFNVWLNVNATMTYYTIYDSINALKFSDSLSTNIPTARVTGHGFVATNSGTTACALGRLDYQNMEIRRALPGRRTR